VIARNNESPPVDAGISKGRGRRTGQQLFEEIILNTERSLAKKLGNSEQLEQWMKKKSFNSARREWLDGLRCFAKKQGLGSLYDIHAGVQQTLEPTKDFTLVMLRRSSEPLVTLRKQAGVIDAAAREGDIEFFKKINLAFESRGRRAEAEADSLFWLTTFFCTGSLDCFG
jgi:hypothetical protein